MALADRAAIQPLRFDGLVVAEKSTSCSRE